MSTCATLIAGKDVVSTSFRNIELIFISFQEESVRELMVMVMAMAIALFGASTVTHATSTQLVQIDTPPPPTNNLYQGPNDRIWKHITRPIFPVRSAERESVASKTQKP